VIAGTVGPTSNRCLIIIKAESQEGFIEKTAGQTVTMEYINKLLLTPYSKLYKIGMFVETTRNQGNGARKVSDFRAFIFDSNITSNDDRKAAKYFYSNFLGLSIPGNAKQQTRTFFESTSTFIKAANLSAEEKVDLQNALTTYIKTDQRAVINPGDFSTQYITPELRDQYEEYIESQGLPLASIPKDTTLIKGKLRFRKLTFSSSIKIVAPADQFASLVQILEETAEYTTLKINGVLLEQE